MPKGGIVRNAGGTAFLLCEIANKNIPSFSVLFIFVL